MAADRAPEMSPAAWRCALPGCRSRNVGARVHDALRDARNRTGEHAQPMLVREQSNRSLELARPLEEIAERVEPRGPGTTTETRRH